MNIRILAATVSFAALATALAGCASPEPEPASSDAQEQDFVKQGGATLTAAGDEDLRISLLALDGVKARTKNQRFIKALVFRKSKSFGAFCTVSGEVSADKERAKIGCSIGVETVSNDDDESLSFDIVVERSAAGEKVTLSGVDYAGDGTFLGDQAAIIGHGEGKQPLPLTVRESTNIDKNPLLLARLLLDATKPLVGQKVQSEEVDAPVATKSVFFMADTKMNVSGSLSLGRTGVLYAALEEESILKTPGDPSKGLLDAASLTKRLEAKLPR